MGDTWDNWDHRHGPTPGPPPLPSHWRHSGPEDAERLERENEEYRKSAPKPISESALGKAFIREMEAIQDLPNPRTRWAMVDLHQMSERELRHLQSKGALTDGERIAVEASRWWQQTQAASADFRAKCKEAKRLGREEPLPYWETQNPHEPEA